MSLEGGGMGCVYVCVGMWVVDGVACHSYYVTHSPLDVAWYLPEVLLLGALQLASL